MSLRLCTSGAKIQKERTRVMDTFSQKQGSLLVPVSLVRIAECFGSEWNFKGHLDQPLLPWVGTPSTRSAFSKSHPTWPWTFLRKSWTLPEQFLDEEALCGYKIWWRKATPMLSEETLVSALAGWLIAALRRNSPAGQENPFCCQVLHPGRRAVKPQIPAEGH